MYEIIIDGNSVTKTKNQNPTVYNNVKVWAAQGKYLPVSLAKIKDFKYINIGASSSVAPTSVNPTNGEPTTGSPTTDPPTTIPSTTLVPTNAVPTNVALTTVAQTTGTGDFI